ncbi:hypothetical protein E2C01_047787 [Portunus trituberculatus]|uniref:Uncharacterized protein n=1 Tax=Portunus trituberculatus TaxID=210409 RepID=A0A5B7GBG4_PORTR|nr:hypothetical protein [Portunus trituberculatus]
MKAEKQLHCCWPPRAVGQGRSRQSSSSGPPQSRLEYLANYVSSCEYLALVLECYDEPLEEFVQATRGTSLSNLWAASPRYGPVNVTPFFRLKVYSPRDYCFYVSHRGKGKRLAAGCWERILERTYRRVSGGSWWLDIASRGKKRYGA